VKLSYRIVFCHFSILGVSPPHDLDAGTETGGKTTRDYDALIRNPLTEGIYLLNIVILSSGQTKLLYVTGQRRSYDEELGWGV